MGNLWSLIIEDDVDLASAFTEILELSGLRTELVQNGSLALKRLENVEPDMVLLDLHLPEVSGVEIFNYIRSEKRLENTRVVIISADVVRAEQLEGKADLVLIKPARLADLFGLVDRLFPDHQ
ncbi:MAG: response regulator [Candidatus Promineifilaceae bacterium]